MHGPLVRADRGLGSSFGKEHVTRYSKGACDHCGRGSYLNGGDRCEGCGAPIAALRHEPSITVWGPGMGIPIYGIKETEKISDLMYDSDTLRIA